MSRVCEECGAPATVLINDVKVFDTGYMVEHRIHSTHYFCDKHKRGSISYGGWVTDARAGVEPWKK